MDEVTYVKTRLRQAYYYWLRKIRKKTCESLVPTVPRQDTSVAFAKVEMRTLQTNTATAITVHLPTVRSHLKLGNNFQIGVGHKAGIFSN